EILLAVAKITYHPQSGWFEDTPLKGGTEEGCPLKGVHEGTFLIEAGHPAWNHSRASGLTVVLRLGLLYGLGSGAPPQDVLSSHSTPERQSLFESHRQRRWLTRWSYSRRCLRHLSVANERWTCISPWGHRCSPPKATPLLKWERSTCLLGTSVNTWTNLSSFSPCCVDSGIIISSALSTRRRNHSVNSSYPWRNKPKTLSCSWRRTVRWGRRYSTWVRSPLRTRT